MADPKPKPTRLPPPRGHLGARRPERYKLDSHLATVEREVGEWALDIRHRARQAQRLVYKKRKPVKAGKGYRVRVAGRGMVVVGRGVAGATAATAAGAYLTGRWTARHTSRGVKWAAPRVKRVAGQQSRTIGRHTKTYGGQAARKATRLRACKRVQVRRMRRYLANDLDRRHTRSIERNRDRWAKVLLGGAIRVAPKRDRSPLSRLKPTPADVRAQRAEEKAIREAQRQLKDSKRDARRREREANKPPAGVRRRGLLLPGFESRPARPERPQPLRKVIIPPPGTRLTVPQVRNPSSSSTKAARAASKAISRGGNMARDLPRELEKLFIQIGDYQPEDYSDWMHFLNGLLKAWRAGSAGFNTLATRMDAVERMDPGALHPLYMKSEVFIGLMELTRVSAREFMYRYADRFDPNSGRGRTMRDESTFFPGR